MAEPVPATVAVPAEAAAPAAAAPAAAGGADAKASNPLFGKAPSAEKLRKMQEKEAKKKAAKAAAGVTGAGAAAAAAGPAAASAAVDAEAAAAAIRALEYTPKVPKGTRDSTPEQMAIREKAFGIIKGVFLRHGAVGIDTPVFELRETLTGKYGEDSKLIYDLANQGGELCSLRYDLTVPFARYLGTHGVDHIKRYHIARVYRRDNPAMNKGRFREFYQCDYDIAGSYPLMVADSEALKVVTEVLDQLPGIGEYQVRLNHRKLLDGMMQLCGVPDDKLRPICSAIDKLDKEVWDCGAPAVEGATAAKCSCVKHEMVRTKGLDEAVADKLGELVKIKGPPLQVLEQLKTVPGFGAPIDGAAPAQESQAAVGLRELETLFTYLQALGCLHRICFDLSLARGLDYYTGVIYEAAQLGESRVGSIAAGGRYDGLVGMFSAKQVPAVGVSIGIERILSIMEEAEAKKGKIRKNATQVYVASVGDGLLVQRMQLASALWSSGIAAEYAFDVNPKWNKQAEAAAAGGVPYMLVLGEVGEPEAGSKKATRMEGHARIMDRTRKPPAGSHPMGDLVSFEEATSEIKKRIQAAEREAEEAALAQSMAKAQI